MLIFAWRKSHDSKFECYIFMCDHQVRDVKIFILGATKRYQNSSAKLKLALVDVRRSVILQ